MEIGTVRRVDIEDTMRTAYLSYAMSVITARALPDVRDGLKPVQRRILYAMWDMGIRHGQPTRKSARIVGEVLGKYHPHGNDAVYDAMVRMAQDFAMRYPLVEGQGNFGSVDGDSAAAMRYTEARLSAIGQELLQDIDKNTVDFGDNFDGSLQEPLVLPGKLPNLLVNGVGGIAVGMATNVPPHNLGEIADAVAYLVDHYDNLDDVTLDDLMRYVKGPDFPTGGTILGREGIRQAYATGKGRIITRAQAHVEDGRGGQSSIIITELPYQVNKAGLVERIAKLVRDDRIDGIGDLRDESDRTGMRIVIELKRGIEATPVLEKLLKQTQLQTTFGANMLALVGGEPRLLSLKAAIVHYIEHRSEVLVRRTEYELERARARAHILEGLLVALDNLDEVIQTIRRSRTVDTARKNLRTRFKLTEVQAQAILDMQLRRLAALERKKIQEEYQEVLARIEYLQGLLASKNNILAIVKADILELKKTYGDRRRTRIVDADGSSDFSAEDLMPDEESVLLLTRKGVLRRFSIRAYQSKRAGEHSVPGMTVRERDVVQAVAMANSRDSVLFVTDRGKAYNLLVHQLPDISQQEDGVELSALAPLDPDERPLAVVPLPDGEGYLSLGTRQGKVKRVEAKELQAVGRDGDTIMGLADDDELVWAVPTPGDAELMIVSQEGKAIRFAEESVRPQGLAATGVRGISLASGDAVAGGDRVYDGGELMLVTRVGFAKRTPLKEYSAQGRGGQGALTLDAAKLAVSGPVAAVAVTQPDDQVVFITDDNAMLRVQVSDVPRLGRASWGRVVTRTRRGAVVQVDDNRVVGMVRIAARGGSSKDDGSGGKAGGNSGSGGPTASGGGRSQKSSTLAATESASKASGSSSTTRRRRTRSTSRKSATQTVMAMDDATEVESAQPTAKKRTTTRRRKTTAASGAKTEPAAAESVAPKKTTRRRTTKRAATQADDGDQQASAEKPATTRRRRRRTTKPKTTAPEASPEPKPDAAPEPKPASSRRRRSTTTRKTTRRPRKKAE